MSTTIAWSWKKINCSISGDALSCKPKWPHVGISFLKEEIIFLVGA